MKTMTDSIKRSHDMAMMRSDTMVQLDRIGHVTKLWRVGMLTDVELTEALRRV